MGNTERKAEKESGTVVGSDEVAGGVAFLSAIITGFLTISVGEKVIQGQLTGSILPGGLRFVAAVLVSVMVILTAIVALFTLSSVINKIGVPKINDKTEYTLWGSGGFVGVFLSIIYWGVVSVTSNNQLTGLFFEPTGESVVALGLVAIPLSIVFYEFYKPDVSPIKSSGEKGMDFDPEFVKQQTAKRTKTQGPTLQDEVNQSQLSNKNNTKPDVEETVEGNGSTLSDESSDKSSTANKEYRWMTETNVSFEDIGGMTELKNELQRDVIKPLTTHREKAQSLGISAPNIIFHGPPGTGKTFMAKGLATELGLPFAKLSGADIQSKWINESSQKVKTLFDEARELSNEYGGAVVFLDELDSVLKDRSGSSGHEEDNKVVNEFLNHLEGTEDHNIVFIGATNRLESIDEAGMRSGRIDKKVFIGKPDLEARKQVLKVQLEQRPSNITDEELEQVAIDSSGLVAADLELVVKNAAKRVLGRDGDEITGDDLMKAVDEI